MVILFLTLIISKCSNHYMMMDYKYKKLQWLRKKYMLLWTVRRFILSKYTSELAFQNITWQVSSWHFHFSESAPLVPFCTGYNSSVYISWYTYMHTHVFSQSDFVTSVQFISFAITQKTFTSLGKILVIFSNYFLNTWMMLSHLFNEVNIHIILKLFLILVFLILQILLIEPTKLYTCFTVRPITKASSMQQGNNLFSRGSQRRTQGESPTLSPQSRGQFLRGKGEQVLPSATGAGFNWRTFELHHL